METYLDKILLAHRETAAADGRPLDALLQTAAGMDSCRGFREAIKVTNNVALIAELKRRSPSKGALNEIAEPDSLAKSYEDGGATCLSVLTDSEFFGGSNDDLAVARAAVKLPVIRKDFTVSANDVVDARIMGADAVLLIVAALDQKELADFLALAREVGLDALVEIHDEAELERALDVGPNLIGVNQRDLVTFKVDSKRASRVGKLIAETASTGLDIVSVAESGIVDVADIEQLSTVGFEAILVGETLVKSGDPQAMASKLSSVSKV